MHQSVNWDIDSTQEEAARPGTSASGHVSGLWLVTFSDLMSVMLAFFVMLFAMSALQTEAWKAMVSGLSDELSPGQEITILKKEKQSRPDRLMELKAMDLHYLEAVLVEKFRNHSLLSGARIKQADGRLLIALPADLIFQAEEGQFAPGAQQTFEAIGQALSSIKNRIEMHVYVADSAVNALSAVDRSASAWNLAITRSMMMRKMVLQNGIELPVIPVAHVISGNSDHMADSFIELVIREAGRR